MGIQGLDPFIPAYVTGLAQGGVILYGVLVIALPVSAHISCKRLMLMFKGLKSNRKATRKESLIIFGITSAVILAALGCPDSRHLVFF